MTEPIFSNLWTPDDEYLRLVFAIYWQYGNPSFEVFYLKSCPAFNPRSIATIEEIVFERLVMRPRVGDEPVPLRAIYVADSVVTLDQRDITAAGIHFIALP